ncbi:MAG: hypothetical protein ACOCVC_04355 [Spirochaeta sp.]
MKKSVKRRINRQDFIFTIGYTGMAAVVDAEGKKRYGNLSAQQLMDKGLYRCAFASVIYDNNETELQQFVDEFRTKTRIQVESVDQVRRLFGVYQVPDGIEKVIPV